jgi:multidrug resistance efflux pump
MTPNPSATLSVVSADTSARRLSTLRALDCINTALAQASFEIAATAVAGELSHAFACEHVVIGMSQGARCKPVAWSGVADLRQEFRLARAVSAAMEESIDQNATLRFPPEADDPPHILLMHSDLAAAGIGESLLTLPLVAHQQIVGALCLIREKHRVWPHEDIASLENLASAIGPVLELKLRSQDSAWARLCRDGRDYLTRLTSHGHLRTKALTLGLLAMLLAACLIPIDANVAAPAHLEGLIQRSITAPVDSFIKQVFVRPGDQVRQGQTLLLLADQELRNQQRKLESELARFQSEHAEAFARQDRSRMVIAQAHADESAAQLALIEDQLSRTEVQAPFDGLIIQGDLQQQVGAPVKRGDALLTLAPSKGFRIVLQVEDRDIDAISIGARGRLTLSAMPFESMEIVVERITPLARFINGHNVFEVQARLLSDIKGLRPGLEGVAKIAQPPRSLLMQFGSRLVEWLRFHLWSLIG